MKRTYKITTTEYTIPERCRKPRYVEEEHDITVNIKELTSADVLPVFNVISFDCEPCLIVRYNNKNYQQVQDRHPDYNTEEFQNAQRGERSPLWINQTVDNMTESWLKWLLCIDQFKYKSYKENKKFYINRAKDIIIVDGKLFKRCGEPYYCPITFGLGHNHGGTSLQLCFAEPSERKIRGFSALDRKGAIDAALNIAIGRGDTNYIDHIKNYYEEIKVLDDTAVRKKYYYD